MLTSITSTTAQGPPEAHVHVKFRAACGLTYYSSSGTAKTCRRVGVYDWTHGNVCRHACLCPCVYVRVLHTKLLSTIMRGMQDNTSFASRRQPTLPKESQLAEVLRSTVAGSSFLAIALNTVRNLRQRTFSFLTALAASPLCRSYITCAFKEYHIISIICECRRVCTDFGILPCHAKLHTSNCETRC